MSNTVNTEMIILARESRGITQQELADRIGIHKANASRLEAGGTIINEETVSIIASITQYPVSFFYQTGKVMPVNLAYRRRQNVPIKLITPIEAKINIIRRHVQLLAVELNKAVPALPQYECNEKNTAADIAIALRKKWNVYPGVIENLTRLIEKQGIIVAGFNFGTERVDSRSILTDNKYPLIVLNKSMLADRQRFSLAYELGHLVMHTFSPVAHNRDIAHEANAFAAEFLMPAKEIKKDFNQPITLSLLGELKRKWKASMISLLYRADDLGFLTPNQNRYLVQQFNQLKIRRREPPELDAPVEDPQLLKQWLATYANKNKLNSKQTAASLYLEIDDFNTYYG
jgi:Zn-dependent peptidase ImmA (M78 family)/transcriptional regulator with XRE-family HTH domain